MPPRMTQRYCADAEALGAMRRDGLGWGHDLECGTFQDVARHAKPSSFARFLTSFKRSV